MEMKTKAKVGISLEDQTRTKVATIASLKVTSKRIVGS